MSPHTRFKRLLTRISYPGLALETTYEPGHNYFLRVTAPEGTCNTTGQPHPWNGRKWLLSPHMTDGEVVWTAFKAILTALEHEAREQFKFDGVAVADSHVDIHKLAAFMADPANHSSRHAPAQS